VVTAEDSNFQPYLLLFEGAGSNPAGVVFLHVGEGVHCFIYFLNKKIPKFLRVLKVALQCMLSGHGTHFYDV